MTQKISDLKDVQGGLVGFNKDHVKLVFVALPPDPSSARALVRDLIPQLTSGWEVLQFNELFSEIHKRRGAASDIIQASWVNFWLSRAGITKLGDTTAAFPDEFTQGMAARAGTLGDQGKSAPTGWDSPFNAAEPDAVLYIAADTIDGLQHRHDTLLVSVTGHGGSVVGEQDGNTRDGANRGHEHFGFKDGIAQPGIKGFTHSPRTGDVAAGEFVVGHPDSEGNISGEPHAAASAPVTDSMYNQNPTPLPTQPLPRWMKNASMVVYRKLQQDVGGFEASMQNDAAGTGLDADQLGARIVGRWPSGAPLEHVPGEPADIDTTTADPSVQHPGVLDANHIDRFNYDHDPDGLRVPRAAHIRKVNPRSEALPDGDKSSLHRMMRHGIPYGTDFVPGTGPYPDVVDPSQDRGLLFISYQASIEDGFEFVQRNWINRADFPQTGDGADPMVSQATDLRPFTLPPTGHVDFKAWVFTRAGAYFISPSLTGLMTLATDPPAEATPASIAS